MRTAAEMENLRRRTAREIQDAGPMRSPISRATCFRSPTICAGALDAVSEEAKKADSSLASLVEGVEMTERSMLTTLERHGVKRLDPVGEKFDPHFHQAIFEVPNPDVAANTVVQVMQSGYSIGERVLRPAMVGVSKGGPRHPVNDAPAEPGPINEDAEKDA